MIRPINADTLEEEIESLRVTVGGKSSAEDLKESILRVIFEQKTIQLEGYSEEVLRRLLRAGYQWIVKDADSTVWACENKPEKHRCDWQMPGKKEREGMFPTNIFLNAEDIPLVQWEDREATNIRRLLGY